LSERGKIFNTAKIAGGGQQMIFNAVFGDKYMVIEPYLTPHPF
jgi:hypothetical protein